MNQDTQNIIKGVIEKISINTEEISFSSDDSQAVWCQIKTKEPQFLIGRDGEILSALNHLVRKIVEKSFFDENSTRSQASGIVRSLASFPKIIIDVNDYQKKKIEDLKTLAHTLSERVVFFKSDITTDPLPAFDRKIIHEFLIEKPNIKTESIGIDPFRKIIIKYSE